MPKLTIHDLFQAKKEGRQFVEIRTSDLNAEEARLQQLRIAAFRALYDDVSSGGYPAQAHISGIKDDEFEGFISRLS
jgi:hypothetical protein